MNNKKTKKEGDGFWEEGTFVETVSDEEVKEKIKTFHKKHDEDMNFNCKKCRTKISAHNKDWHSGMCDNCFNQMYHYAGNEEKRKRAIARDEPKASIE